MGWKWLGIDGKGYANTTYISDLHPHIPKPWFRNMFFDFYMFFTCFGTQNRFFLMLPEKYLTGVGHRDADWKVSASEIDMNFGLWEKNRNLKFNICLPPNHGFGDCGFFLISRIHLSLGELGLGRLGEPVDGHRGNRGRALSFAWSLRSWVRTVLGKPS